MAFAGGIPGFAQNPCGTKKSTAEPRHMTFEAQNFLLNKDTWLLTLTFGRCGDVYSSGLLGGIVDTKIIVFWGKNARIYASCLLFSTDQPVFLVFKEKSEHTSTFWASPGNGGKNVKTFRWDQKAANTKPLHGI